VPNFAGDARAALLFVYILTYAGETADVVDNAAVTREVSLPRKAFFFGWRVEGLREYSFRSSSPAFRISSVKRLTRSLSPGIGAGLALRKGELLQQLTMENPSVSVIKLIVVFDLLSSTRVVARAFPWSCLAVLSSCLAILYSLSNVMRVPPAC
jgi:hypothetical protein